MKKIIILSTAAVFLFYSSLLFGSDIIVNDGNDWLSYEKNDKVFYIMGFVSGMGCIVQEENKSISSQIKQMNEAKESAEKESDNESIKSYIMIDVSQEEQNFNINKYDLHSIKVGQFVDALDDFYKDFNNRNIRIIDAIYVAKKQLNGIPKEEIQRIILYLRNPDKFLSSKEDSFVSVLKNVDLYSGEWRR